MISKLSGVSDFEPQAFLWPETAPGDGSIPQNWQTSLSDLLWSYYHYGSTRSRTFYTSSLPRGTTTGVLRHHALRQHSLASCEKVPRSSFPSTCTGDLPFTTTFSSESSEARICAPGNSTNVPWTRTRNRQTIDEELWIDFWSNQYVPRVNVTLHCTSNSSRGYFELGNYHNGNVPSPLLEKWPGPQEMAADFNDAMGYTDDEIIPSEM
jgi:hypothetical protein